MCKTGLRMTVQRAARLTCTRLCLAVHLLNRWRVGCCTYDRCAAAAVRLLRRRFFFQARGDWAEALVQRLSAHADSLLPLASHQADSMLEDALRVGAGEGGRRD